MKNYYKSNHTMCKIKLSDNISLLMPPHMDDDIELMVAIGMLTQMYACNHKMQNKRFDPDKLKKMMCEYIDKVVQDDTI